MAYSFKLILNVQFFESYNQLISYHAVCSWLKFHSTHKQQNDLFWVYSQFYLHIFIISIENKINI